jgi:hypothetical protein
MGNNAGPVIAALRLLSLLIYFLCWFVFDNQRRSSWTPVPSD